MSVDSNKIYFGYTEYIPKGHIEFFTKSGIPSIRGIGTARATVALQVKNGVVYYGISVCSNEDSFNKKEGRKLAEERLNSGNNAFPVPEHITSMKPNAEGKLIPWDNHDVSLYFLRNMIRSVENDIRKVQQRIGKKASKKPSKPYLLQPSDLKIK